MIWDEPLPRTPSGKVVRSRLAMEAPGKSSELVERLTSFAALRDHSLEAEGEVEEVGQDGEGCGDGHPRVIEGDLHEGTRSPTRSLRSLINTVRGPRSTRPHTKPDSPHDCDSGHS